MIWLFYHSDHKNHQSSKTATWVWVIWNCWLWALLSLSMLVRRRNEKSKYFQSLQDFLAHWLLEIVFISWMIGVWWGLLGENGSDDCANVNSILWEDATYSILGMMLIMVCCKRDYAPCLYGNLCCIIVSENGILVLVVACGVGRHAVSLNQSTSLISKHFL